MRRKEEEEGMTGVIEGLFSLLEADGPSSAIPSPIGELYYGGGGNCQGEHAVPGADDNLGAYRGVFRWFMRSRTRACLLDRHAVLDPSVCCPYYGARVWNMVAANLVSRGASRRMSSDEGWLEYYICVSGHVHGNCWLAHLTSSDGEHDDPDEASGGSSGEDDDVAR
ncbi:EID1-like F-box protein 3 [Hordeum vulgare]|nr:EID1-like F-box protein 3 [Hordeum vulgare]